MDLEIFSTASLLGQGFTTASLRRACAHGEFVRLRRGKYRRARPSDRQPVTQWPPGEAELRHCFLMAAALPMADGTVFSHHSAGVLHGLPVPFGDLAVIATLRDGSGQGTSSRSRKLRRAALPDSDVITEHGVPVTTLVRTVVDLTRTLAFPDGVAAADAALRADPAGGEELRAQCLAALRARQTGNTMARRALTFADRRSESPGESRCRATFALAGVPEPTLQFEVRDGRRELIGRADFCWERYRVLGEYDGTVKYGRDLAPGLSIEDIVFREKARENRLREQGWQVLRFVAADLRDPAQVRARLERAFTRGSAGVPATGSTSSRWHLSPAGVAAPAR
ncbi:type IV toxin-antitoxin system AbiEi family antitoxin domain-containing protein [Granulicoccus phenolivorans]|uniref:type IV toxin-antitoxin system AbiEi family antitoxin domain-containing protein n=1 Tax=Granulicoccus phenolivorans TaxID=266854 RepID=UPI00040DBC8A|nr:type IV toxin-antitoxin system AbiEi family antitoxin domain-containing protein [Granulicoccus phenolivorans]